MRFFAVFVAVGGLIFNGSALAQESESVDLVTDEVVEPAPTEDAVVTEPQAESPPSSEEEAVSADAASEPATETESQGQASAEEEEATTSQEPAVAAPSGSATDVASTQEGSSDGAQSKSLFGRYKIKLGASKPTFADGAKCYDKLYGDSAVHPTFGVDYYPFDWFVTIGLGVHVGWYKDTGKAARAIPGVGKPETCEAIEKDVNGKTELTLIPVKGVVSLQATPFRGKWIVLEGFAGIERTYFQESRIAESESGESSALFSARTRRTLMAESSTTEEDTILTNKGSKDAVVIGGFAHFLLNPLDEASVLSAERSLGISHIYLSPGLEIVSASDGSGVNWARTSYTVAFTFESN